MSWTLDKAVEVCKIVEEIAPRHSAHVALTGGTLYKDGERKDLDLLFYGVRQSNGVCRTTLENELMKLGFEHGERYGWLTKSTYQGKTVDLFYPELYPCSPETTERYGI